MYRLLLLLAEFFPFFAPFAIGLWLVLKKTLSHAENANNFFQKWKPTLDIIFVVLGIAATLNWLYFLQRPNIDLSMQYAQVNETGHLNLRQCPSSDSDCSIIAMIHAGSIVKKNPDMNKLIHQKDGQSILWKHVNVVEGKVCLPKDIVNTSDCIFCDCHSWYSDVKKTEGWVSGKYLKDIYR